MMPFMHNSPANPRLLVNPGTVSMKVSQDLANIRPVILGAIVRGVDVDDAFDKEINGTPGKVAFRFRRGRKRASIGVHDLSKISPPFRLRQ